MRLVLPAPDGPMMATCSPASMDRLTERSAKRSGAATGVKVAAISQSQHGLGGCQQARSSGGRLDPVVILGLRADVACCYVKGQDLLAFGGLWAEL